MINDVAAESDAVVLTWFHAVQVERYRVHISAPSALPGATEACALLSGTLNTMVTKTQPIR